MSKLKLSKITPRLPKILYDSNNSGGRFWLKPEDWKALEKAGWEIDKRTFMGENTAATRTGLSLEKAIREWEEVTEQDSNAQGCPCCGNPHNFYEVREEPKVE